MEIGLYAIGYLATREAGGSLDVRHGVEMIRAPSEYIAICIGGQFARFDLPPSEGWTNHRVVSRPANMPLKSSFDWVKPDLGTTTLASPGQGG